MKLHPDLPTTHDQDFVIFDGLCLPKVAFAPIDCNLIERRFPRLNNLHQGSNIMQKKVWQAPQVQTTPVSMEVTTYLPAQA